MTEKPDAWATMAGSRLSASAVVSMTRVLEDWAAGAAATGAQPKTGSSRTPRASSIRATSAVSRGEWSETEGRAWNGITAPPGTIKAKVAGCKNSQQIFAPSMLTERGRAVKFD